MCDQKYFEQVVFMPWEGSAFQQQKRKILFLGESHYGVSNDVPDFTTEVIRRQFSEGQDQGRGFGVTKFHGNVFRTFSEFESSIDNRKTFWNTVAFYNFVQVGLESQSVRPTRVQFEDSVSAFCEVVCRLKPDVVVVLGLAVWDDLPIDSRLNWTHVSTHGVQSPTAAFKRSLELWRGNASSNEVRHDFYCFFLPHPSWRSYGAAINWREWPKAAFALIDNL